SDHDGEKYRCGPLIRNCSKLNSTHATINPSCTERYIGALVGTSSRDQRRGEVAMRKRPAGEINLPVVLIVEDEFFVRCELADCAREAGFVVVEAASAKQALAAYHVKTAVCALITDMQLEDPTNGWDLAGAFRAVR